MDKAAIIFSIWTHDYDFMLWFGGIITFPVGFGHLWHFRSSTESTEKELAEIDPRFEEIKAWYIFLSIMWLGG